ncbi:hypothetical protein J132_08119 [Termitomyces sp. J132]|nr:hypothetical protein H2248_004098 [Termitomyces sp. 'cryptogamus']KNZ71608.1 hypothetical protein J132_08119 [Termitomyces sp. J132]
MSHLSTIQAFEKTMKQLGIEYDPHEVPEHSKSPLDINPHALKDDALSMTHKKKYYDLNKKYSTYVKCSLFPSEYMVNIWGKIVHPHFVKERLQNEVAAIAVRFR